MLRNRSYSQSIIAHNQKPLDINLSNYKNERLIYPQSGDSGFYQGTGRRHYESSIKQLIFNYGFEEKRNLLEKYSQKKNKQQILDNPQTKKQNGKYDSLDQLEAEFRQKQKQKEKQEKTKMSNIFQSQKICHKSPQIPKKRSESYFKLFGNVGDIYDMVHESKIKQVPIDNSPRSFNPTNLSFKFNGV